MSHLRTMFHRTGQLASLTNGFSNTLRLTTKPPVPTTSFALFATQSKDKTLELPKKPMTSFFLFRQDIDQELKRQNPNASIGELGKMAGEQWKQVNDAQKEKYNKLFTDAMDAYKTKMAAIEADPKLSLLLSEIKAKKSTASKEKAYKKALQQKKSLLKDLGKPKNSTNSAYMVFSSEKFSSFHQKGTTASETAKKVADAWATLTEQQKQPYLEKYNKIKETYDAELVAWNEKMSGNQEYLESIKSVSAKVSKTKKKQDQSKTE